MDWPMMDWLILVLVTPFIIVAVVLLYGFVGCSSFGTNVTPIQIPTNLKAAASAADRIDLNWDSASPAVTKEFSLERRKTSETKWEQLVSLPGRPNPVPANPGLLPTSFDPVDEASDFTYRVLAIANDGSKSDYSNEASAQTLLKAPSSFVAIPTGTIIQLSWINHSTKATSLKIERSLTPVGGYSLLVDLPANQVSFPNSGPGVKPDTKYYYHITAYGPDNKVSTTVETSAIISLVWKTCFTAPINLDGGNGYAGHCLVQRIKGYVPGNPASLQEEGYWVQITMFSNGTQETKLTAVYISRVGAGNPYDSAGDNTQVTFGGAAGVTLSQALGPKQSDPIKYSVDRDQDLIVAFDVSLDSKNIHYGNAIGPRLFAKSPTAPGVPVQEAHLQVRPGIYQAPQVDRVNCVQKIEVA